MQLRSLYALLILLLSMSAPHVHAISFFENIRYRSSSTTTYPSYTVRPTYNYFPPTTYSSRNSGSCLYYNTSGECMIEQYYDPSNAYRNSYPVYDRGYVYNERRKNERYDYRDYDDDYYDDDDYYYDDDDDYYDDDDDFDYDEYFGDNDDDDDDSDDDDDD